MSNPKILLIHGWNYTNYTSSGCVDAWSNRSKFLQVLSQHFNVVTINLPGFCGEPDPKKPWGLDDFVQYVSMIIEKENPEYILGYSFGGAIVLRWKEISKDSRVKAILVSPAIVRKYKYHNLGFVQNILKEILPDKIITFLRNFYLTHVVKNPYYTKATNIMRETYRNIVTVDLSQSLISVTEPLTLIYGENDSATPLVLVQNILKNSKTHHLHIISGGGHDIANTHTNELVTLIMKEKGD